MSNTFQIINDEHAIMLRDELTKVRCWISGFKAGRSRDNLGIGVNVPGDDAIRQAIGEIDSALVAKNNPPTPEADEEA